MCVVEKPHFFNMAVDLNIVQKPRTNYFVCGCGEVPLTSVGMYGQHNVYQTQHTKQAVHISKTLTLNIMKVVKIHFKKNTQLHAKEK